jgi:DNA/RNA-binding domain of Phe-tRNA-synthetase-like protein
MPIGQLIEIEPTAAAAFPEVAVVARTVPLFADSLGPATDRLWMAAHASWNGESRAAIRRHPRIEAYRRLAVAIGTDPDRQQPSIQALIDRGLRGKPPRSWPTINPIVDAVNAVAVTELIALGVFDADRLDGDVRLALTTGGEPFLALGADAVTELQPGRLVLADAGRVLSLFAHRDGVHQAVTAQTTNIMVLACAVPGISVKDADAALARACQLLATGE